MRRCLGSSALPPPLCGSGKFSFFWGTVVAIALLRKKFGMFQSEWALLDGKSKKYLLENFSFLSEDTLDSVLQAACAHLAIDGADASAV
jgi:hypothetical protein